MCQVYIQKRRLQRVLGRSVCALKNTNNRNLTRRIGSVPPLFYLTLTRVTGFSFYQKAKYTLSDGIERMTGSSPLDEVNTPGTLPNLATISCFTLAGSISGIATTFLACRYLISPSYPSLLMRFCKRPFRARQECHPDFDSHVQRL